MREEPELTGFIELDRRFEKLERDGPPETTALRSYTTGSFSSVFGAPSGISWAELLEDRLVVVLGEPGSGKTWEFRERAGLLNSAGEFAFYIQLDQLVTASIPQILEPHTSQRFNKWLRSNQAAFFFLDSVDEAKFHKIADFYTALDRFVAAIGVTALPRVTTLISCRISEWQQQSDAYEVTRRLRSPHIPLFRASPSPRTDKKSAANLANKADFTRSSQSAEDDKAPSVLVVQLQPLDRARVEKFVRARGVKECGAFINSIDKNYAWEFVRRPVDVVDLMKFWLDRRRLAGLSEMIGYDIDNKLRPSKRDQNDPLSFEKALSGAQALAASTTFCRQFNFKVPDDDFVAEGAMDARAIVPATWRIDEVKALLTRPMHRVNGCKLCVARLRLRVHITGADRMAAHRR